MIERPNHPSAAPERKRLLLKRGRDRSIANRHPWIFSGAIAREEGPAGAAIGDLFDDDGQLLASGFYSEHSQIRLRAWSFDQAVDEAFVLAALDRAIARRASMRGDSTNAVRLVNSEGDGMSGLVVDLFADVVVLEITSAGLESLRDAIVDHLRRTLGLRAVVVKNDLPPRKIERLPLDDVRYGAELDSVEITENGLRFEVALRGAQKTGFFLDQRDNRLLARSLAAGRRVLNLFSYSGAFGVSAASGGATSVEEVDSSADAIELARRNHELNGTASRASFTTGNAFEVVRKKNQANERFDLVICDPPAFAKSRNDIEKAARGYKDVNIYAMKLVERGGMMMTFSCSGHIDLELFQKIIFSAAADAGREASIVRRLGAAADHPVSLYCPEGEYLKGFLLQFA